MSCLGVHFALSDEDVATIRAIENEQERLAYLQEEIEERYLAEPGTYAAESDKAWDAMHRALADGQLTLDGGTYPLNHAVLAGELLYTDNDYIMSLKSPAQVKDIATELEKITEESFQARYLAISPSEYGMELSDDDFLYTWEWFENVRQLYRRAAAEKLHVLFTADQ
ncbi:MAG: YfbM family protein [Blastocatellia bacterium]